MLAVGAVVRTGKGGRARVALADGSEVRLGEDGLLKLGVLALDAQLKRKVQLEVVRGRLEVVAAPSEGGAFLVASRAGLAGEFPGARAEIEALTR